MSELTWEQISLLDLDAIDDAASKWATYNGQMGDVAEAIESDVSSTIDEDSFGDQLGEDSRAQLRNISNELQDHIDEAAKKIKVILEDAHEEFETCKNDMQDLIDEVLEAKLRIEEDGTVKISDARIEEIQTWAQQKAEDEGGHALGHAMEKKEQIEQDECQPLTERIQQVIESARGHDDDFTQRLNSIRDAHVEGPPPLGSDWHEDVAQYYADRAVDLLNGGADGEMSPEELDEFNELVSERSDNPVFATTLMNELGPDGYTEALADVALDVYGHGGNESDFTPEQVDAFYEAMGVSLATATDTDNPQHVDEEWVTGLMNFGDENIATVDGNAYGYQLLGPALEHGEYHSDFIVPVTDHILAMDNGDVPYFDSSTTGLERGLGSPFSHSPVNSALTALDNSPEAALDFFTESGTRLDHMDGVGLEHANPVDDPMDYLMDAADDAGRYMDYIDPNLVGNALEAGATGISTSDEFDPDNPPHQTPQMSMLADRVIETVTDDPDRFTTGGLNEMTDNFGGITASYIDDFQRSMASDPDSDMWIDSGGDLSSIAGDQELAGEWLKVVGHDEGGMSQVWGASEALMYDQMTNAADNHDGQSSNAYNESFELHGRLTGALTVGALEGIADGVYQEQSDQNGAVDRFAEGAKYGASVAGGAATGNPFSGAAIGQGAGYGIDFVADYFRMSDEEAQQQISDLANDQTSANEDRMRDATTLNHIEGILDEDSNLTAEDKSVLMDNYYERYWDNVSWVANGYGA
ncbi:hypothetical protein [Glycomyces xiaoerkulensis]|uniref:hypothetical protein n=1 Tax=Glycomyces xiaoerkulensis TaxID=2038139 RepID=UPI000C25983D|nr:hypothetical protein [Glycomyces xiaoerkulensis]